MRVTVLTSGGLDQQIAGGGGECHSGPESVCREREGEGLDLSSVANIPTNKLSKLENGCTPAPQKHHIH